MEVTKESLEKQHYGLLKELFNYISKEDGVSDFDSWAEQNSIEKGNFLALGNTEDSTSTTKSFKSARSQVSSKARSPERMEQELLHLEIPGSTSVPRDEQEVEEIPEPPASMQKRSDSGGKSANQQLEPQLSELESSAEHVMNDDEFGVMDQPDTAKMDEDESMKSIHNIEESNKLISKQDAVSNELPRNYVKIYPAKMKKQGKPAKGYQILGSRLKIEAKPLTRVIPTANKTISTSDWKVNRVD